MTKAMVLYEKKPQVKVINVRALPVRQDALTRFTEWITPWFRDYFEDSLGALVREMRGYFRSDREFRALVKRGEKRKAKRVLKELMGCID